MRSKATCRGDGVRLLLDTHALLWWANDDARLGPIARGMIANSDNVVLVSQASLWEIAVKLGAGKLRLDLGALLAAIDERGLGRLPITDAHLVALGGLERRHRDPFDHLLVAQALVEGATLMTQDTVLADYPVVMVGCR